MYLKRIPKNSTVNGSYLRPTIAQMYPVPSPEEQMTELEEILV